MAPRSLLLLLALSPAGAQTLPAAPTPPVPAPKAEVQSNVVLITLDGVRWQEWLGNAPDPGLAHGDAAPVAPWFWATLARQGVVYGDARAGGVMSVANPAFVSLPAYQSIMAGRTMPCANNDCGRITVETLPERLIRTLKLKPEEAATFATWDRIALAVEHVPGTTLVSHSPGNYPGIDRTTWSRALAHLKAKRPRFLYISLGDADTAAHAKDYHSYLSILRQYDAWLNDLFAALSSLGEYGRATTVLVTTDHGRGKGAHWKDHGGDPDAKAIWLYARGPSTARSGAVGGTHSHLDIRPTIEALLGLCSSAGKGTGRPLAEVVPSPPAACSP